LSLKHFGRGFDSRRLHFSPNLRFGWKIESPVVFYGAPFSGYREQVTGFILKKKTKHFVYIIKTADGTYYTGMTKNIKNRLALHESGKGAKYLRGRTPLTMVYCESCPDIKTAMVREIQIKKYSKRRKEALVKPPRVRKIKT